jgi:uncharacterized protein (TIGR03382 family)
VDRSSDWTSLRADAPWDRRLYRILPIVFALSTGFQITKYIVVPQGLGFDAQLYVLAAERWLAGGDPWSATLLGIRFAAPPPTLLAVTPLTLLPPSLIAPIVMVVLLALAWLAIRSLGLPLWWLAFWPITDSILVGNPDVAVLAALVIAGRRFDFLAPFGKIYAVVPMIADRRWRSIAVSALAMILTAPLLPWALYVAQFSALAASLEAVSATTSVYGAPVLMAVAVVSLLVLGVRRAGWLSVPILWPWTQPHYMAISVPALSPTIAIAWSVPGCPPAIALGGVVAAAIGTALQRTAQADLNTGPNAVTQGS